jgi:AbiV family abortive infection protein
MVSHIDKFQRSILACLKNGKELLEDAEWTTHQASAGLALALLAQEESAKAFVLALVRDEVMPWTKEVHRSLSVHECKNLVMMVMEWLSTVNELRLGETLARSTRSEDPQHLPADVATAMNIYRHEMIERIGRRGHERCSDWRGAARKVAEGHRDRKKQTALYVGIHKDGDVASQPPTSLEAFEEELARARKLIEFAQDVDRNCLFARHEYRLFAEIFKTMFEDLGSGPGEGASEEEVFSSGIPGVVLVKRTIRVANVAPELGEQADPRIDTPEDS